MSPRILKLAIISLLSLLFLAAFGQTLRSPMHDQNNIIVAPTGFWNSQTNDASFSNAVNRVLLLPPSGFWQTQHTRTDFSNAVNATVTVNDTLLWRRAPTNEFFVLAVNSVATNVSGSSRTLWSVANITNAGTAAYSNAADFYPAHNPSNFVQSAQLGTAAFASSDSFYPASNPSNFITAAESGFTPHVNGVYGDVIYWAINTNWANGRWETNFTVGLNAGKYANPNRQYSMIIGSEAGMYASSALRPTFIGYEAGKYASGADSATFLGTAAGYDAQSSTLTTLLGYSAGRYMRYAERTTAVGTDAGRYATNHMYSVDIGQGAGNYADGAHRSVSVGQYAGRFNKAQGSVMIGYLAGDVGDVMGSDSNALASTNDAYAVFIGYQAGKATNVANADGSIAIGYNAMASKPNQVVLGGSNITETLLRGNVLATLAHDDYDMQETYDIVLTNDLGRPNVINLPRVLYYPTNWHGYRYWMMWTPEGTDNNYFGTRRAAMSKSHNGVHWTWVGNVPALAGNYVGHSLVKYGDVIACYFATSASFGGSNCVSLMFTTNGVDWTTPVGVATNSSVCEGVAVVHVGLTNWLMYQLEYNSAQGLVRKSQDNGYTWSEAVPVNLVNWKVGGTTNHWWGLYTKAWMFGNKLYLYTGRGHDWDHTFANLYMSYPQGTANNAEEYSSLYYKLGTNFTLLACGDSRDTVVQLLRPPLGHLWDPGFWPVSPENAAINHVDIVPKKRSGDYMIADLFATTQKWTNMIYGVHSNHFMLMRDVPIRMTFDQYVTVSNSVTSDLINYGNLTLRGNGNIIMTTNGGSVYWGTNYAAAFHYLRNRDPEHAVITVDSFLRDVQFSIGTDTDEDFQPSLTFSNSSGPHSILAHKPLYAHSLTATNGLWVGTNRNNYITDGLSQIDGTLVVTGVIHGDGSGITNISGLGGGGDVYLADQNNFSASNYFGAGIGIGTNYLHNITSVVNGVTVNDSRIILKAGTTVPVITFAGDTDTGIYSSAADSVNIMRAGASYLLVNNYGTVVQNGYMNVTTPGSAATPSYRWTSDTDTGFFNVLNTAVGVSVNGAEKARFSLDGAIFTNVWSTNGFYVLSNALSAWPASPAVRGQAFIGNSNGVLYALTSLPTGTLQWSETNALVINSNALWTATDTRVTQATNGTVLAATRLNAPTNLVAGTTVTIDSSKLYQTLTAGSAVTISGFSNLDLNRYNVFSVEITNSSLTTFQVTFPTGTHFIGHTNACYVEGAKEAIISFWIRKDRTNAAIATQYFAP